MPWCPECKTEYEEHVTECADCHIPLVDVDDPDKIEQFKLLAYVPEAEVRDIIEYLEYSKIDPIKQENTESGLALYVDEKQHKDAYKYLRVYMMERVQDEEGEEVELPEYDTIDVSEGRMSKELKSSAFSFLLIGGLMLVFGLLNILDVLTILRSPMYNYVIAAIGLIFLVIGIFTYRKIPEAEARESESISKIEAFVAWFDDKYDRSSYLKKKRVKTNQYDEGSLYFVVIDLLKKDLETAYPDEDSLLINSACEQIYEKHFNE